MLRPARTREEYPWYRVPPNSGFTLPNPLLLAFRDGMLGSYSRNSVSTAVPMEIVLITGTYFILTHRLILIGKIYRRFIGGLDKISSLIQK